MREKRVEDRVQANHNQKEHQPADKSECKQHNCRDEHDYRDVVGQQHVDEVASAVVRVRDRLGRGSGCGVGAGHGCGGCGVGTGRARGAVVGCGVGAGRGFCAVVGRRALAG